MTALLIWWWRLRYGFRIFLRSRAHSDFIGSYLKMCLIEIATAGWEYAIYSEGSIEAALKEDPIEWADEELSCWTD